MASSILSAGVPITFVLLVLAFNGSFAERVPKIQPSVRITAPDNTTEANMTVKGLGLNAGVNVGGDASVGQGRPLFGNAGVNAGVGVGGNTVLGQALGSFGSALGASVGGVLGSVASVVTSPLALLRPFFTGGNTVPANQQTYPPFYQQPYYPFFSTSNNVGLAGWGSFGANTGTVSYDQCNAMWREAILREAMNYDDWKCSGRLVGGVIQPCVLTGAVGTSVSSSITGCGWKMPLFCDDSINDIVYTLRGSSTAVPATPAGYTYVAGVGTYKVHTETRTWADAKTACEQEGAHLAIPSTSAEYTAIQNLLNTANPTNNGGWVGINDIAVEGVYVTVTGQPACNLPQLLFQAGDPNNGGNGGTPENCIHFGVGRTATLYDNVCTTLLPFVCEITLPSRLATCRTTSG